MANQFKKLRCPEDQMKPVYKIEELEKAGIGKHSAIYKYESGESKPGYDAIKAYKKLFHCSYEYLFDEAPLPLEKHKYITDDSLLGKLDTNSIDNLEKLLTDENYANFNTHMLKAFLADPTTLQNTMDILFRFMYQLNSIYSDTSIRQAEKELLASNLWFSLNRNLDTYLRDILMPNLQTAFRKFEAKQEEREKKGAEYAMKKYEAYKKQNNATPTINITSIKPIKDTE